jgi:hypothetical protein
MPLGLSKAIIVSSSKIMAGKPTRSLWGSDDSRRKWFYFPAQVTGLRLCGKIQVTESLSLRPSWVKQSNLTA